MVFIVTKNGEEEIRTWGINHSFSGWIQTNIQNVKRRKENGKSRNDWKSIDIKINGLRLMGCPSLVSK